VEDGAAAAPAEFTLGELPTRLEGTVCRANETNEIAQTKLKQAEERRCSAEPAPRAGCREGAMSSASSRATPCLRSSFRN
jgi:hypothetical protein